VLLGRSPITAETQRELATIAVHGARVEYRQVDVTRAEGVQQLVREITATFGPVSGVIHSAGVIRDEFLLKKAATDFDAVLAPEIAGAINLDLATREHRLDFFAPCSSVAGALGNPGQGDYATGNAFLDAFAEQRQQFVRAGERSGQSVSINWPLWRDGGMRLDAANEKLLEQRTGLTPLETSDGLRALTVALASGATQVMVLAGDVKRLRRVFAAEPVSAAAPVPEMVASSDRAALAAPALDYFKFSASRHAQAVRPGTSRRRAARGVWRRFYSRDADDRRAREGIRAALEDAVLRVSDPARARAVFRDGPRRETCGSCWAKGW